MIRSKSVPGRQGAEGAARVSRQPRRAERVGDRLVSVTEQERGLEDEGHALDDAASARFDRLDVSELALEILHGCVEPLVGARRFGDLAEEGFKRRGILRHASKDVQALDVARALPDPVQRRLAIEAGHAGLLDEAVASEAFERLCRVGRRALVHPVLEYGIGQAAELDRALVAGSRLVV